MLCFPYVGAFFVSMGAVSKDASPLRKFQRAPVEPPRIIAIIIFNKL